MSKPKDQEFKEQFLKLLEDKEIQEKIKQIILDDLQQLNPIRETVQRMIEN